MIRGTTAQFKFILPCETSLLSTVEIIFWQNQYYGPTSDRPLPIVKTFEQCHCNEMNAYELSVTLNQEETLRFTEHLKGYVQLKSRAIDGSVYASKKREFTIYPVYDDSILGDEVLPTPSDDGLIYLDGGTVDL